MDGFRRLPSVDWLIQQAPLVDGDWPRALATQAARVALAEARAAVAAGAPAPPPEQVVASARTWLSAQLQPSLRVAVNATGVILHTNLGRAPLASDAAAAMAAVGAAYSNLEFDLATGERGSRTTHLRGLLQAVTGAEDGLAVNNNAGAVLLALSALAAGQEVIVSRGQAVEIGGGFRIPDVLRQSGARLVEVGTTNRTRLADYAAAITPQTALLLRVHPSNFRITGFVESVGVAELVELGQRTGVLVLDDVGSGALLDPAAYGLAGEPLVQDSVRAGASVVCFSGDKLLGGPQAGLLVGQRAALERIRRHPLARALRIDKASLAGLEATLRHYRLGDALTAIPVWSMISEPAERLEARARALVAALAPHLGETAVGAVPTRATVGGGSLPQETLPSWAVQVRPVAGVGPVRPAHDLAARLRQHRPPVVGRVEHDALVLDLRTVRAEQDPIVRTALVAAGGG
jgi:L-seryl-tRNA(Ser) seleniumtransferase